MAKRKDDLLWKAVLEDVFEDFLYFFFPDAYERFNMEKGFVYLDKEFDRLDVSDDRVPGLRFVDKLVQVFLKNNDDDWVLVHVEVQSQKGKEDFSERMFRYWYRIKDKYNKQVTAFAILTDGNSNFQPERYVEEYLGTGLHYRFNTYKLLDQDEGELRSDPNPFSVVALVVLMSLKNNKADDQRLKKIKHDLVSELNKREVQGIKYKGIMNFVKYYDRFKDPAVMLEFEKEVERLNGKTITMGTEEYLLLKAENEGLEKGKEEERAKFVKNLILQLGLTNKQAANVAEVSMRFVKRVRAVL